MTIIRNIETGKVRQSLVCDPEFLDAIEGLQSFVLDNFADLDLSYDWVCEMANCSSFVDDNPAWDMFIKTWESAAEDAGLPDHILAGDYRY